MSSLFPRELFQHEVIYCSEIYIGSKKEDEILYVGKKYYRFFLDEFEGTLQVKVINMLQ